jgi:hypothetical protein
VIWVVLFPLREGGMQVQHGLCGRARLRLQAPVPCGLVCCVAFGCATAVQARHLFAVVPPFLRLCCADGVQSPGAWQEVDAIAGCKR